MNICFAPLFRVFLSALLMMSLMSTASANAPVPSQGSLLGAAAPVQPKAMLSANTGLSGSVISANAKTVRLRKDTILRVRLLQDLNTSSLRNGEGFNAYLDENLYGTASRIVLPKGSVLRGRVLDVQPSRFFSKGASFRLDFDHVTLPSGDILPVALKVGSVNQLSQTVRADGSIYEDPGYSQKFITILDKSAYVVSDLTRKGYQAGREKGGQVLGAVTGTFSAIGGGVAGMGYLVGQSAYYAVAKGDSASLDKTDALYVQLLVDTDVPVSTP
ncbi:MAG: hypothetical protein HEQ32_09015 [Vampirovibrio sp.]